MRNTMLVKLVLILALATGMAFAQKVGDAMQAKRNNTELFENEVRGTYETSIGSIGTADVVTITEIRRNHFKVRTSGGAEGFVEKRDMNRASAATAAKNRAFAFEAAEVVGYLDNPMPIHIIDMDDPNAEPITLERSFKEALKENVDKETMERLAR